MATMASIPACLLSTVPVIHPPNLEGDPSLATEILPGPPSLASVRLPPKKFDPKKPVPPVSYLPTSDPGTTYAGLGTAAPLATIVGSGPRRKRARMDKGTSHRAQRASARGCANAAPHVPPEPIADSQPAIGMDVDPSPVPPDDDITLVAPSSSVENNGEGPSKPTSGRGRRRADKRLVPEHADAPMFVKEEPLAHQIPDIVPSTTAAQSMRGQTNEDHCSACSSLGCLIYCDGCPRAFHLWCLDPPVEDSEENDNLWYCPKCVASQHPPPKLGSPFFAPLIHQLQISNPVEFQLPEDIRTWFRDVATGPRGSYVDSSTLKAPRLGRTGMGEERDSYRLKDSKGVAVLCFKCGRSALPEPPSAPPPNPTASSSSTSISASKRPKRAAASVANANIASLISITQAMQAEQWRTIISCDFCPLHWHLDCLDPPLANPPPGGRKWKCPNHASNVAPKRRWPKHSGPPVDITTTDQPNNGNIEIINIDTTSKPVEKIPVEEVMINGRRYRVPERVIVLDFWSKVKQGRTDRDKEERRRQVVAEPEPAPFSFNSSPLTSLSSLPDVDSDSPPPPSSATQVPPKRLNDEDDTRRVAELLCSLHVQPPTRMTNGNPPPIHSSTSTSNRKRKDMAIQTEPVIVVTLDNVRQEHMNDGMDVEPLTKPKPITVEIPPSLELPPKKRARKSLPASLALSAGHAHTIGAAGGANARQYSHHSQYSQHVPPPSTPTPTVNGRPPLRNTSRQGAHPSPLPLPSTPGRKTQAHTTNLKPVSSLTGSGGATGYTQAGTGSPERTPNSQSGHGPLKIRIPGLGSLKHAQAQGGGSGLPGSHGHGSSGLAMGEGTSNGHHTTSNSSRHMAIKGSGSSGTSTGTTGTSTSTSTNTTMGKTTEPRRSLRRRASHSGSNGSTLTSVSESTRSSSKEMSLSDE